MKHLPKGLFKSSLDFNEIEDAEVSDLIETNYAYWCELDDWTKRSIAWWWLEQAGQCCYELLGEDEPGESISESELVQYLTEEGYLIGHAED